MCLNDEVGVVNKQYTKSLPQGNDNTVSNHEIHLITSLNPSSLLTYLLNVTGIDLYVFLV